MTEREDHRPTVRLEGGTPALSQPEFIIAADGKYYLTVAIWQYDYPTAGDDEEKKRGVEKIAHKLRDLRNAGWERVAVQSPPEDYVGLSAQHTVPLL